VDLAGSERRTRTGDDTKRHEEATSINLALTTLGKVIQALVEQQQKKKSKSLCTIS